MILIKGFTAEQSERAWMKVLLLVCIVFTTRSDR